MLNANTKASFRGLSVVSNKIVWASGSKGTVIKSLDGGKTWEQFSVAGYENTEFRDIEAFDKKTAVIMGIDTPAVILRTEDGGVTWNRTYFNNNKGMFLDAMEFWNLNAGIVIGDPINGRFFIARTFDGGKTWTDLPFEKRPIADSGEACFAASGTNIVKITNAEAVFITGGLVSNLHVRDKTHKLPLVQGKETTGANGIAIKNKKTYIIVGGDFNAATDTTGVCAITTDGGETFTNPIKSPNGYRSGIAWMGKNKWITCGLNGVDISTDGGQHFSSISKDGFHVVKKAKKGNAIFLAGGAGRIGKLVE